MNSERSDPLRVLIDLVVFAPIGLVVLAQRELPHLVASGRERVANRIKLARFVGRVAVTKAKSELDRRLDEAELERQLRGVTAPEISADSEPSSAEAAMSVIEIEIGIDVEPAGQVVETAVDEAGETADELPIEGYDSLAASQVVLRLGSLTMAELQVVSSYEQAHRARRTVLGKISQLQAR